MKKFLILTAIVLSGFIINSVYAEQITVVTGEIIPYSYKLGDTQIGVGSDIVAEIAKRVSYTKKPVSLPWPRAIRNSLEDNTIIYPLARVPQRENQYLWIGPIVDDALVFYMRADDTRTFTNINELKDLRIGVLRAAPPGKKLEALGFTKLDFVSEEATNLKKLNKSRIDAWFSTQLICEFTIRKAGFDSNNYKLGLKDSELVFYLGASKNIQPHTEKWQKALDEMKKDGTHKKILIKNHIEN